jgi:hypothetical protein
MYPDSRAYRLDDFLKRDYMALVRYGYGWDGGNRQDASIALRNISSDTLAPDWLREFGREVMEIAPQRER